MTKEILELPFITQWQAIALDKIRNKKEPKTSQTLGKEEREREPETLYSCCFSLKWLVS